MRSARRAGRGSEENCPSPPVLAPSARPPSSRPAASAVREQRTRRPVPPDHCPQQPVRERDRLLARPPQPAPGSSRRRGTRPADVRRVTAAEQQREPDLRHQSRPEDAPLFFRTAFDTVGQTHPVEEGANHCKLTAGNEAAYAARTHGECVRFRVVPARNSLRTGHLGGPFPLAAAGFGINIPA